MQEFKDVNGNIWNLRLTIGAMERVKAALGFDLLSPETKQGDAELDLFNMTVRDPYFELKCAVVACDSQLEKFGYTRETALEYFGGEEAAVAKQAFLKEYEDFFQAIGKRGQAKYLRTCLELCERWQDELEATVSAINIDELVKNAVVNAETAEFFGKQFGDMRERLESTPET